MSRGLLITFEGGEGAGKSTLIERLYEALISQQKSVIKTRAPGGTPTGVAIRNLLLNQQEISLGSRTELLLFLADRAQHVEEVIQPALQRGQLVLCDRYNDSSVAYQGIARGLGEERVRNLCHFACQGLEADVTFYLDLDPEVGLKRVTQAKIDKDKIEAEALSFHQKIRQAFHQIAAKEERRMQLIDASLPAEVVFQQVMKKIASFTPL